MRKAEQNFDNLLQVLEPAVARAGIAALLEWDQETYCPPKAREHRGTMVGLAEADRHAAFIDPKVGQAIALAMKQKDRLPNLKRRILERLDEAYRDSVVLPTEFVQRQATAASESEAAWEVAKQKNDWPHFAPHLGRMIDLAREEVAFYGIDPNNATAVYDKLLQDYEPGFSTARLRSVLSVTRDWLTEFLPRLDLQPQTPPRALAGPFVSEAQMHLSRRLLTDLGFDFEAGNLALSVHPFSTWIGRNDTRLTTEIEPGNLVSVHSTAHEAGHAMFDQNGPELLSQCSLFPVSMGVHESQSRMYENIIGRSRAFCRYIMPQLRTLSLDLNSLTAHDLFRAWNIVAPGPVRLEADEVTYNLHIIIRVELEMEFLSGSIKLEDLPAAFSDRCERYLGVRPENDARGILQDGHWSAGMFGYFGTYTLGNLASAQLFRRFEDEFPNWELDVARGEFGPLHRWLQSYVYPYGHTMSVDDLLQRATGEPLNPKYWCRYIERKFAHQLQMA